MKNKIFLHGIYQIFNTTLSQQDGIFRKLYAMNNINFKCKGKMHHWYILPLHLTIKVELNYLNF